MSITFCKPACLAKLVYASIFKKLSFFLVLYFLQFNANAYPEKALKEVYGKHLTTNHLSSPIKGKVVDETGNPIEGVTVAVKGTKTITVTNKSGEFLFKEIEPNVTLVFSSADMNTYELKLDGQEKIEIKLTRKVSSLENVDVIVSNGYQQIPKERATGSFVQIDNKTLNYQSGSNIINRLNGVTSSVLFPIGKSNAPVLTIRGLSSINGPQSPLIVVDNFPYEGDINNINPNDVEGITILKDAAAASIWGTKAGNGVIVITTKKGKLNQPLKLELNGNITIIDKPNLAYLPLISSTDYINLEQYLYTNGYYDNQINNRNHPSLSPALEIFLNKANGLISASDSAAQINVLKTKDTRNDYLDYFYQKAINQQYALNVRGGTPNMSYFFSGGYDKNIDNLAGAYKKINARFDNNYKIVKNLQLMAGMLFTSTITNNGKPPYGSVSIGRGLTVPYLSFKNSNGEATAIPFGTRISYADTLGGGKLLDGHYYPLTDWQHNTTTGNLQDLTARLGLQYEPIKGLRLDVNYQYEKQRLDSKNLADIQSIRTIATINAFTQIDNSLGTVTYIVPPGGILNLSHTDIESQNIRGQVNFNHSYGRHEIAAIAGSEIRQVKTASNSNTVYGFNDNLDTYGQVDFVNPYPTLNGGTGYINNGLAFKDLLNRYVSYYGNVAYTFDNKYIFTASGRRDASNLFGVNTNDKWNPLWSTGIGWNIHREPFFKLSFLSLLKFRASYGFSGNVDPSRAALTTLYINSGIAYTNLNYGTPTNYANPDLRWEKVSILNTGFDFETKGKVLSGSIEYYHKTGRDLFGTSQVDYTTGLLTNTLLKNVASIEGNGIDLVLQTQNINRSFKWQTNFLFNYYKDKVTDYYRPSPLARTYVSDGGSINSIIGKPLYSLVSYKWAGLDKTGRPQGYFNGSLSQDYYGITSATTSKSLETLVYSGPASPVIFGSVMNTFSWKGISVTANVTYRFGYYFRKPSLNYNNLISLGAYVGSGDYAKRWQQPGDESKTNVPSFVYPVNGSADDFYTKSTATVLKADNIRLQFVNLSYEFNERQIRKSKFEKLVVYLNINNVGLLWKANKETLDPDYGINIPPAKNITIGIRCNF